MSLILDIDDRVRNISWQTLNLTQTLTLTLTLNPNLIHTYIYTAIYVRQVAEIVYVDFNALVIVMLGLHVFFLAIKYPCSSLPSS